MKHEFIDSNIVEDSQNAKQELNDSNIEDSQNTELELNYRNNFEDMKTTEIIRDEEESCKKDINKKIEYTTVRNNKDTDGILKFEKQEVTSGLLESKERENNQTLKMYKMEKSKSKIKSLKKRK